MERYSVALLLTLMIFVLVGCGSEHSNPNFAKLKCVRITDLERIPSEARVAGVDFVTALHSYDTQRIHELVVPEQREWVAKEAFNGPNTAPVKMLETPQVTGGSLCDKAVKLTLRTSAEYSAGYKRGTTIYLTMQQRGNDWFVVEMAADYDS